MNLGGLIGMKLGFRIGNQWTTEVGIDAGMQQYSLSYDLSGDQYNMPFRSHSRAKSTAVYLGIPLTINYSRACKEHYVVSGFMGINQHSLLMLGSGGTSYGQTDPDTGVDYQILNLSGDNQPGYHTGASFGLGIGKCLANGNIIQLEVCCNFSWQRVYSLDYTFFPDWEQFRTTGQWYSYGNFIGLSLNYMVF
jgi:hypothetical protein